MFHGLLEGYGLGIKETGGGPVAQVDPEAVEETIGTLGTLVVVEEMPSIWFMHHRNFG
jgi:hypothetical protein